jgi:hypothetical protein
VTVHFANTSGPKNAQPASEAEIAASPPPATARARPQVVLPSTVDFESRGLTEGAKIGAGRDSFQDNLSLGVRDSRVTEEKKEITTWAADETQPRIFYERYAIAPPKTEGATTVLPSADTGTADNRVQVSGQLDHFYSDLNRTPPVTPPPASGAAIAINGVEQSTFAGRGISPTTGLPADDVSRDGAALGQTLAVTRADPATRSYGLGFEPANRESGAGGGGAGGAGGAFTVGDAPVGSQTAPGHVAAGDVVAGLRVTPTPALLPTKPQEAVPPIVS